MQTPEWACVPRSTAREPCRGAKRGSPALVLAGAPSSCRRRNVDARPSLPSIPTSELQWPAGLRSACAEQPVKGGWGRRAWAQSSPLPAPPTRGVFRVPHRKSSSHSGSSFLAEMARTTSCRRAAAQRGLVAHRERAPCRGRNLQPSMPASTHRARTSLRAPMPCRTGSRTHCRSAS